MKFIHIKPNKLTNLFILSFNKTISQLLLSSINDFIIEGIGYFSSVANITSKKKTIKTC